MKMTLTSLGLVLLHVSAVAAQVEFFPVNGAVDVNPDTRLRLVFEGTPPLQNQGKIKIYDASNDAVVDELDMSIPPGPRNTRTPAPYDTFKYSSVPDTVFTVNSPDTDTSHVYQKNLVGGTGDGSARHFFPVLVDDKTATISPHNHCLEYGKTYYVLIDPQVFDGFGGISDKSAWTFTTKTLPPPSDAKRLVVSAQSAGDFSTFQGAIDAIPDGSSEPKEIYVENGTYDEIVVLQNRQNLTFIGEDRSQVVVRYATNGVFNSGGRSEFTIKSATDIQLVNFTIQSVGKDENPAQAEALYVKGDKLQVHEVTLLGSGDALQIQADTRIFLSGSSVRGYGDNFLSYGAAFFRNCHLISTYGPHGWPRNPQTNHGDVFVNSTFSLEGMGTSGDGHCALARSPTSGVSFPYAEFVLINCKLQGIIPEGWGAAGPDYTNVHFWEYNSVNLSDGMPVDVSKRVSYSRQLTMDKDAETIANYSDPTYVLAGWTPELAPIVVKQLPESLTIPVGESADLSAEAAAEPEPMYQWFKDGQPLAGETNATLTIHDAASGEYTVSIANTAGMVMSRATKVNSASTAGTTAAISGAGGAAAGAPAGSTGGQGQAGTAGTAGAQTSSSKPAASMMGGSAPAKAGEAGSTPGMATAAISSNDAAKPAGSSGCAVSSSSSGGHAWPWLATALFLLRRRSKRAAVTAATLGSPQKTKKIVG
jgi:pectin methylesterase-like acyl-CoA thioesterase